MKELEYINWLIEHESTQEQPTSNEGPHISIPIGDDCAEVALPAKASMLLAADMLIDTVHFRIGEASPEEIGHKALAVNLSDIAAMAGHPCFALVSLAIPSDLSAACGITAQEFLQRFHNGMSALAKRHQVKIVGGDTNATSGPFTVAVTIVGQSPRGGAVSRSGAKVGDWIFVTGPLGGSQSGQHLRFEPRLKESKAIHACTTIHAMIDLSDGLATDLKHILKQSNVGAKLVRSQIPITLELKKHCDTAQQLKHALTDGEDFELCFTVSEAGAKTLLSETFANQADGHVARPIHIGYITSGHSLCWEDGLPIYDHGFEHQA